LPTASLQRSGIAHEITGASQLKQQRATVPQLVFPVSLGCDSLMVVLDLCLKPRRDPAGKSTGFQYSVWPELSMPYTVVSGKSQTPLAKLGGRHVYSPGVIINNSVQIFACI
jgi:hypothetical protein